MKIQTKTSCPLCGVLPDQSAWDAEHIIPSGIGGRRTLRNLYCTACNRRTGEQRDNFLRDELHHFLVMFGVKRDRKPLPALILDNQAGGKVRVEADGTLLPLEPVKGYPERILVRVVHPAVPPMTFRTYHPSYLRRSKRAEEILGKIEELIGFP